MMEQNAKINGGYDFDTNGYPSNRNVVIKIDNIPPGKNWKQIKYLIGGIIHHSKVLKIKLLPSLTSIVPPFVTFQSCVVTLKMNPEDKEMNQLLFTINSYQWDYYNLFAYILPDAFNYSQPMEQMHTISPPMHAPHMQMQGGGPFATQFPSPSLQPNRSPIINDMNMVNPPINYGNPMMPPPPMFKMMPRSLPRNRYSQKPINDLEEDYTTDTPLNKKKRDSLIKLVQETSTSLDTLDLNNPNSDIMSTKETLRQIFNEACFRKQMTRRGMWQLLLDDFPPFIQSESVKTEEDLTEDELKNITTVVETEHLPKFLRLKWNALKDFIKLKCLRFLRSPEGDEFKISPNVLFNNTTSRLPIDNFNSFNMNNTTREFYVGIYDDHEELIKVILKSSNPESPNNVTKEVKYMNAIFYKAVVGFHDKELYELSLKSLQNQQYLPGYNLRVTELPPYNENTDGSKMDANKTMDNKKNKTISTMKLKKDSEIKRTNRNFSLGSSSSSPNLKNMNQQISLQSQLL